MTRLEYQVRMEDQFRQWGLRRDAIKEMAEKAGEDIKRNIWLEFSEMEKLLQAGKGHLRGLENMAIDAWEAGKVELVEKWNQVGGAVDAVWGRVRTLAR
ncbi:MAG: hypothetical protein IPK50_22370 [Fibrobacterota bacterium]|nr:hypothetical protein [Fibrobacterota bacterium]QQS04990.1 MAG: hypothetical protein IPK50_22370 [Fibrobacterota bacterium]